jgi:RHS repeat-associated protein
VGHKPRELIVRFRRVPEETNHRTPWGNHQVASPANKGRVLGYTCTMVVRAAPSVISSPDAVSVTCRIVVSYERSSTRYFLPDHLNSTNVVTDASGTPLLVEDYYPYGSTRVTQQFSGFNEQKQYIGQYEDPETNLNYLQARYYDGSKGEFLSEDPVFLGDPKSQDLQNPQNLNSYSYAIDNPINKSDPLGKHVELVSRPIGDVAGIPTSQFGAHAFVYVAPDNPNSIGSIAGVNTSNAFALSGIPTSYVNGNLMKTANDPTDLMYGTCGTTLCQGSARVTVAPPAGMTSAQFDTAVVASYNNLPSNLGPYDFLSAPRAAGWPNSNNAASAILLGAGVSQSQLYQYRGTLQNTNNRWTPGLGVSATAPTYAQQALTQISATLKTISSLISTLAAGK